MTRECSCRHDSPMALETPRTPVRPEQTVADVTGHCARAVGIMKEMGINHCCGAHLTLRELAFPGCSTYRTSQYHSPSRWHPI